MGEKRTACRIFVGKPEGKRPLGRPRRRWVDNQWISIQSSWLEVPGSIPGAAGFSEK
jgi:hypothetical protein